MSGLMRIMRIMTMTWTTFTEAHIRRRSRTAPAMKKRTEKNIYRKRESTAAIAMMKDADVTGRHIIAAVRGNNITILIGGLRKFFR